LRVNGTSTEFASSLSVVSSVWASKKAAGGRSSFPAHKFMQIQFHAFDILGTELCKMKLGKRLLILQAKAQRFGLDTSMNPIFRLAKWTQLKGATPELRQQEIDAEMAKYA